VIEQTQEDRSHKHEGGSAFTDVVRHESPCVAFFLCGAGQEIGIDIMRGEFIVNGVVAGRPDASAKLLQLTDVSVHYERTVTKHRTTVPGQASIDTTVIGPYYIGFKGLLPDGTEKKYFMECE
jgi:hypothetical protein